MACGVVGGPRRIAKRVALRIVPVGVRPAVFGVLAPTDLGADLLAEVGPAGLRACGVLGLWMTLPS